MILMLKMQDDYIIWRRMEEERRRKEEKGEFLQNISKVFQMLPIVDVYIVVYTLVLLALKCIQKTLK